MNEGREVLSREQVMPDVADMLTDVRVEATFPDGRKLVTLHQPIGFFETSFMPGRTFASPADFDAQFTDWLRLANARVVSTIKTRPVDLLDAANAAMLPLPPVAPAVERVNRVRLGRDYYVRVESNDHSVDPNVIGRFVDVHADLTRVEVRHEGRLVAGHDRVWARGTTVTDTVHVAAAKVLCAQLQLPRPADEEHNGLVRDLADYGRAFGLVGSVTTTDELTDVTMDGEVA